MTTRQPIAPEVAAAILVTGQNEKIDADSTSGPWGNKLVIDTPYSVSVVPQNLIPSRACWSRSIL
jgi:outer membrane receptor for monomeric catechols